MNAAQTQLSDVSWPPRASGRTSVFLSILTACACLPLVACAGPLTITQRGVVSFATASTTDQFGTSFTITGLSGIAWRGGDDYIGVMDNSNKLVFFHVPVNGNGSIASITVTGGLSLADTRDFEGIAYTDPTRNSVFLSEETTPTVLEYSLTDGARLQTLPTPAFFSNIRSNFGFESLARAWNCTELWTANEEALTVDGALSTQSAGTTVRLLRFNLSGTPVAAEQYAYLTAPWHGAQVSNSARSGVSDLISLPDGRLLTLERSLAFSFNGLYQNRIYELNLTGATQLAGTPLEAGLIGQSYTPAGKSLLWTGSNNNMEGLCVGPVLGPGRRALIGIIDDGDPLSVNALVAFELTGVRAPGDVNCDGAVNNFDIDAFVLAIVSPATFAAAYPRCDISNADIDGGGAVNNFDIDPFVDCILTGACS